MRCLALLLIIPSAAHAQPLSARLSVEREAGAEQCAESADLRRRVDAILGRPASNGEPSEGLTIDVHFARATDGAFVARVSASGSKPGQRQLRDSGASCEALGDAVSVAIALLLDSSGNDVPDAGSTSGQRQRQPDAPVTRPPTESERSSDAAPTPGAGASMWRAQARVGAGAGYGLGGGTWLGSVGLGARSQHWLLELGAAGTAPHSTGFDAGTVRTSLLLASFRACYLVGRPMAIGPCAQLGLGRLRGEGLGFDGAQTSSLPWTAGGLGLAAQAPLGPRWFAAFGATLWVPTRRQTFSVQYAGIAWESKPVAGVVGAELGARLF